VFESCRQLINSFILLVKKSQTFAKVSLVDSERRRAEAAEDREAAEQRARVAEQRVRELEAYLEDEGGDFTKAQRETERTLAELNELRAQYDRAMNDRDYTVEATRQRFQHELENLAVSPTPFGSSNILFLHNHELWE
jgi:myosin protein heavy chain